MNIDVKHCDKCKGEGIIYEYTGNNDIPRKCFLCKGTGHIVKLE